MCDAVDSSGASVCDAGWTNDFDDDFRDKETQRWGGRDVVDGQIGKSLMAPHRHIRNPFLHEARMQWFACSYEHEPSGASEDADNRRSSERDSDREEPERHLGGNVKFDDKGITGTIKGSIEDSKSSTEGRISGTYDPDSGKLSGEVEFILKW